LHTCFSCITSQRGDGDDKSSRSGSESGSDSDPRDAIIARLTALGRSRAPRPVPRARSNQEKKRGNTVYLNHISNDGHTVIDNCLSSSSEHADIDRDEQNLQKASSTLLSRCLSRMPKPWISARHPVRKLLSLITCALGCTCCPAKKKMTCGKPSRHQGRVERLVPQFLKL